MTVNYKSAFNYNEKQNKFYLQGIYLKNIKWISY